MKTGFTLLELLVVVLMIAILATVALPQYQYAVAKAHMAQLQTRWNALEKAVQLYYLTNSTFPLDVRTLDIGLATQGVRYAQLSTFTSFYKNAKGYVYPNGDQCGTYNAGANGWNVVACGNKDVLFMTLYTATKGLTSPSRRCSAQTAAGERICKNLSSTKKTTGSYATGFHQWDIN